MLIKLWALVNYRKDLSKLLNTINEFWCIDRYGLELKNEIESIYRTANKIMKLMMVILNIVILGFTFQPLFGKSRKLFYKSFYPQDINRSPEYEFAIISQASTIFVGVPLLLGFDGLFISLIMHLICELKLLKKGFENVPIDTKTRKDTKEAMMELYKLVHHHNLILGYC